LSEGDVYTNKVDVWAVGLLLYEICTKKRVFQNANAVMQYFWQEDSLPQIPENHPIYTKMEGTHARLSQIEICNAVAPPSSEAELGPWSSGLEHIGYIPSQTFNEYIEWLLQRDQRRRPSIDEIGFYFAVLYLRIGVIGVSPSRKPNSYQI
jgi:serine/threonine protein kinase